MKADLRNYWVELCLVPYKVSRGNPETINKFVACLVGDETADDKEFGEMSGGAVTCCAHGPCHWEHDGSCFHPFRPGSMCDALFTSVFRGEPNAKQLVDKDTEEYLDHRKCGTCSMGCSRWTLHESAFNGLGHMYDHMFEEVERHGTLFHPWKQFRSRYSHVIDKVPFFLRGSFADYEDNIRAHFDRLAERHYNILEQGVSWKDVPLDKHNDNVANALKAVRFELVMHFANYWDKELYKREDA